MSFPFKESPPCCNSSPNSDSLISFFTCRWPSVWVWHHLPDSHCWEVWCVIWKRGGDHEPGVHSHHLPCPAALPARDPVVQRWSVDNSALFVLWFHCISVLNVLFFYICYLADTDCHVFQMFCCLRPNGPTCTGVVTAPHWRSHTSTKRMRVSTPCVSSPSLDMNPTRPTSLSEVGHVQHSFISHFSECELFTVIMAFEYQNMNKAWSNILPHTHSVKVLKPLILSNVVYLSYLCTDISTATQVNRS